MQEVKHCLQQAGDTFYQLQGHISTFTTAKSRLTFTSFCNILRLQSDVTCFYSTQQQQIACSSFCVHAFPKHFL